MAYLKPPGFDETSSDWDQNQLDLTDLASDYGWSTWADILCTDAPNDFDVTEVRPGAYKTPQEAIAHMMDTQIVEYCRFFYEEITDTWHIVVEYPGD